MRNFAVYELDGIWYILASGKIVYVGRSERECWEMIRSGALDDLMKMCELMCD